MTLDNPLSKTNENLLRFFHNNALCVSVQRQNNVVLDYYAKSQRDKNTISNIKFATEIKKELTKYSQA